MSQNISKRPVFVTLISNNSLFFVLINKADLQTSGLGSADATLLISLYYPIHQIGHIQMDLIDPAMHFHLC
jgi:hypothetical protein